MNLATLASTRLRSFFLNPWRELALFALMVMEACWISALYVASLEGAKPEGLLRAFLVFGVIFFGVHILVRVINHYQIKTRIRRIGLGILFFLSLQAALFILVPRGTNPSIFAFLLNPFQEAAGEIIIPIHFWIMLASALLWLRAISLARYPVGSDLTISSFKFGMVMWFFYGVISLVVVQTRAPWILFLFLFAGLVSMSAGRLTEISGLRGGKQVRFHRAWLVGIAGSTLLILGTGFLISRLLQNELGGLVEGIVILAAGVVLLALMLLISPLVILFLVILPKLDELFSGVNVIARIRNLGDQLLQAMQPLFASEKLQELLRKIWATRAIILMAVIVVLAVIVLMSVRWLQHRQHTAEEDDPEAILSARDMLRLLRDTMRRNINNLMARLRGRRGLPDARRLLAAMRIRWMYFQMAELAENLGYPRPTAATPLEYLPTVQHLFPEQTAQAGVITNAYLQVRYGEVPESDEEIQAVTDAWAQIEAAGKPQLALKQQELKSRSRSKTID